MIKSTLSKMPGNNGHPNYWQSVSAANIANTYGPLVKLTKQPVYVGYSDEDYFFEVEEYR